MAIVKDIDTVKKVVTLYSNVGFDRLAPYVDDVEREYILPILGQVLYDALNAKEVYKDAELALFNEIIKPVIPLALHAALPSLDIGVSAGGLTVTKNNATAPASEWRVKNFRKHLRDSGHNRLDGLMRFLADHKDDYQTLNQVDVLGRPSYLLTDAKSMTKYVGHLKGNRYIFMQMWPMVENIEENVVKDLLGETLYTALIDDIKNTEEDDTHLVKLIPYCRAIIAHFSFADSILPLSMELTANGLSIFNSNYTETIDVQLPAEPARENRLESMHRSKGQDQVEKLLKFLHKNKDNYPDFTESEHYEADEDGDSSAITGSNAGFGDRGFFGF